MDQLASFRSFMAIFNARSVSKAALALNLTQPAVTKQLQQLETRIGKQLFVRVPRGVEPTPAAHDLARRIQPHLEALELVAGGFKLGSSELAGTVMIGGPAEFISVKVLPALASLTALELRLRVTLGQPEALKSGLLSGALDLAVFTVKPSNQLISAVPLYLEELVLVAGERWTERIPREHLSAKLLEDVPLLAYAENLPLLRRYWRTVFGVLPQQSAALIVPNLRALELAAIAGCGVTVLPRYLIEASLRGRALHVLLEPSDPPTNQLFLAWRSTDSLHPRVSAVQGALLRALTRGSTP